MSRSPALWWGRKGGEDDCRGQKTPQRYGVYTSMTPQLSERHQDYVMTIGTLNPGQLLQAIPFKFDPDAPFIMRATALRCQYDSSRFQTGLQGVALRYTGQGQDYKQQAMIPYGLTCAYFGQQGNPRPVSPEIKWPQSGVITVDVENTGASTLTNVQLFFRGVKLYLPGVVKSYTYPRRMSMRPWIYSSVDSGTVVQNLAVSTPSPGIQQIFRPQPDSDFALRSISWGQVPGVQPFEVFVTLMDEDLKPYSNAPVHIDVLMSNPSMGATYPCGSTDLVPLGTGSQAPGLFYPEIYVPKNHIMYYNVVRNDGGFAGQSTITLPFQFNGCKVYKA